MPRYPVKTITAGDCTLAYSDLGSGVPLLCINGLASTMDTWNPPVLLRLSEKFRVIIFDNRGTGYSGTSDIPFSIPLFAQDTAVLMDMLGISSAHILGLSMGASVAQELALGFPEKVKSLILVAGECGGPESVRMQPEILSRLVDKSGSMEDVINRMFSLLFPPAWLKSHDPLRFCPEVYETTTDEVLTRQLTAFFGWRGSFLRLNTLRVPVLVITGTEDIIVPAVNSRILSSQIPGSQLIEIPGAGHGLMYQVPEEFCRQVLAFLDR